MGLHIHTCTHHNHIIHLSVIFENSLVDQLKANETSVKENIVTSGTPAYTCKIHIHVYIHTQKQATEVEDALSQKAANLQQAVQNAEQNVDKLQTQATK